MVRMRAMALAAVAAGAIFVAGGSGFIVSKALEQGTRPGQAEQDVPTTQLANTQAQRSLDQDLDRILQKVDATAEQRAAIQQALELQTQQWRLWMAANCSELEKLLDDASAADAAHDRKAVASIQQKHRALIEVAPRQEETWHIVQSLLTHGQQQKLKMIQEKPPGGTQVVHRILDRSPSEPSAKTCALCHLPHYAI